MKITTIILDDNKEHLTYLEKLLLEIKEVDLIRKFSNSTQAKEWLQQNKVDLLISDIEMKHLNGLELISQTDNPPLVIFASTYPKYAAESFNLQPLHYLVKPIEPTSLREGLERAKNKLNNKQFDDFIIISEGHSLYHKINTADILFVEADNDYTKLICKNKEYRTHSSLKKMATKLGDTFIKTHRSYLVNTAYISVINGVFIAIDKYKIPLSRAYKKEVYQLLSI
jgi:DNA-binding LytR/AlgR family response regulator